MVEVTVVDEFDAEIDVFTATSPVFEFDQHRTIFAQFTPFKLFPNKLSVYTVTVSVFPSNPILNDAPEPLEMEVILEELSRFELYLSR